MKSQFAEKNFDAIIVAERIMLCVILAGAVNSYDRGETLKYAITFFAGACMVFLRNSDLGQYLSTKSTYNEFLKARFKGKFRKDHADEIEKHEKAAQILKAQNPDGSLPKMKDLKLEKERLLALKAAQYDTYTYYKDYQKELRTACANVDSILGQHHIRDHIQRTEQTL